MAQGKDKTTQQVNANIPEAVVAAFEVARARRRLKKQDALAEAMLQWATQKLRVSINPEQALVVGQFDRRLLGLLTAYSIPERVLRIWPNSSSELVSSMRIASSLFITSTPIITRHPSMPRAVSGSTPRSN
jgi:hypothetical protein